MGQFCFAIMFGCETPADVPGFAWGEGVEREIDGEWVDVEWFWSGCAHQPTFDYPHKTMGFFVACAGSGKRGVPRLDGPIDLAAIDSDARYAERIQWLRSCWSVCREYAARHGVPLPEPRLYLVETETR